MKQYNSYIRESIIKDYGTLSIEEIIKKYNVSKSTVYRYCEDKVKQKFNKMIEDKITKQGKEELDKALKESALLYGFNISTWRQCMIKKFINDRYHISMDKYYIKRLMDNNDLFFHIKDKKEYINKDIVKVKQYRDIIDKQLNSLKNIGYDFAYLFYIDLGFIFYFNKDSTYEDIYSYDKDKKYIDSEFTKKNNITMYYSYKSNAKQNYFNKKRSYLILCLYKNKFYVDFMYSRLEAIDTDYDYNIKELYSNIYKGDTYKFLIGIDDKYNIELFSLHHYNHENYFKALKESRYYYNRIEDIEENKKFERKLIINKKRKFFEDFRKGNAEENFVFISAEDKDIYTINLGKAYTNSNKEKFYFMNLFEYEAKTKNKIKDIKDQLSTYLERRKKKYGNKEELEKDIENYLKQVYKKDVIFY